MKPSGIAGRRMERELPDQLQTPGLDLFESRLAVLPMTESPVFKLASLAALVCCVTVLLAVTWTEVALTFRSLSSGPGPGETETCD